MSRLQFTFGCGSLKLAGSLDTAPGTTGLMIVSGGNEIRSGAFSGQSHLAAAIAKNGFPVFRFDRRGVGDSEGENRGYRASTGDIHAAHEAFAAMAPQVNRLFAYGNCDAATALMLAGGDGFDGLILSNPWTIENGEEAEDAETQHAPEAIRARYAEKLKNPREVARLLRGGVDLSKLARGVVASLRASPAPSTLVDEMRAGIEDYAGAIRFLLAEADRTAQLFDAVWDKKDPRISRCAGAGHTYVETEHRKWLEQQILAALRA